MRTMTFTAINNNLASRKNHSRCGFRQVGETLYQQYKLSKLRRFYTVH